MIFGLHLTARSSDSARLRVLRNLGLPFRIPPGRRGRFNGDFRRLFLRRRSGRERPAAALHADRTLGTLPGDFSSWVWNRLPQRTDDQLIILTTSNLGPDRQIGCVEGCIAMAIDPCRIAGCRRLQSRRTSTSRNPTRVSYLTRTAGDGLVDDPDSGDGSFAGACPASEDRDTHGDHRDRGWFGY